MLRYTIPISLLAIGGPALVVSLGIGRVQMGAAFAQDPAFDAPGANYGNFADFGPPVPGTTVQPNAPLPPVPPVVQMVPRPGNNGYCYIGSHPSDPTVEARPSDWHDEDALHFHPYPPVDVRLFSERDDCYVFSGDPVDFGHQGGNVYPYHGAHPNEPVNSGSWCFMGGAHQHLWSPVSSMFVQVGGYYTWQGAYDAYFWSYWPYYTQYYRNQYPNLRGQRGGDRFDRAHRIVPQNQPPHAQNPDIPPVPRLPGAGPSVRPVLPYPGRQANSSLQQQLGATVSGNRALPPMPTGTKNTLRGAPPPNPAPAGNQGAGIGFRRR
ncbi:MAG: hypothetical protein SGI86_23120 [Deltaproteobacteria bacterium]|nr:hypothetical protein [Deltaproteobacteria bacterium]